MDNCCLWFPTSNKPQFGFCPAQYAPPPRPSILLSGMKTQDLNQTSSWRRLGGGRNKGKKAKKHLRKSVVWPCRPRFFKEYVFKQHHHLGVLFCFLLLFFFVCLFVLFSVVVFWLFWFVFLGLLLVFFWGDCLFSRRFKRDKAQNIFSEEEGKLSVVYPS